MKNASLLVKNTFINLTFNFGNLTLVNTIANPCSLGFMPVGSKGGRPQGAILQKTGALIYKVIFCHPKRRIERNTNY